MIEIKLFCAHVSLDFLYVKLQMEIFNMFNRYTFWIFNLLGFIPYIFGWQTVRLITCCLGTLVYICGIHINLRNILNRNFGDYADAPLEITGYNIFGLFVVLFHLADVALAYYFGWSNVFYVSILNTIFSLISVTISQKIKNELGV